MIDYNSFFLGVGFVIFITLVVGMVMFMFRLTKLSKELNEFNQTLLNLERSFQEDIQNVYRRFTEQEVAFEMRINNVNTAISRDIENLYQNLEDFNRELTSSTDSKLDKLENRLKAKD